jgi:hypothetical protein
VTNVREQSLEQAITVTVNLHDTRATMEYGVESAEHGKCAKGWGARSMPGWVLTRYVLELAWKVDVKMRAEGAPEGVDA